MNLLVLTPAKTELVKVICQLEHESLIRLHTGTSTLSPKMEEHLATLEITQEDYLQYSSEAFYEFQRVLEDPKLIISMPKIFMAVVLDVIEAFRNEPELTHFGAWVEIFESEIMTLLNLTPDQLNLN